MSDDGATLLAGFLSALAALIGLVLSKENAVSAFRQTWIDGLREEVSQYLSGIHSVTHSVLFHKQEHDAGRARVDRLALFREIAPMRAELNHLHNKLHLRLNSAEEGHIALTAALDELHELVRPWRADDEESWLYEQPQVDMAVSKLRKITQSVLKTEWGRVKRGESWFHHSKTVLMILLAIIFFVSAYMAFGPSLVEFMGRAR